MAETTQISWADATFNPWVGCAKVSPACDGCYAEHMMATRMGRVAWGGPGQGVGTRERTAAANWKKPLAWDRAAANAGTRPFVFCASLADVFDNAVPAAWRTDLFDLIRATPNLTWLLLTKRPGMIVKLFEETLDSETVAAGKDGSGAPLQTFWPPNAAIGCTVVTQEEADRDVPTLLTAKAALKPAFAFLSMEPLLGTVDLTKFRGKYGEHHQYRDALRGTGRGWAGATIGGASSSFGLPRLDWVITGGETDQGAHKARPSHPDWFRSLRDQCAAAGVAYHHKQNGEWRVTYDRDREDPDWRRCPQAQDHSERYVNLAGGHGFHGERVVFMRKSGKGHAGRLLDGVEHNARPEVTR